MPNLHAATPGRGTAVRGLSPRLAVAVPVAVPAAVAVGLLVLAVESSFAVFLVTTFLVHRPRPSVAELDASPSPPSWP
ncbi:hypothetical protein [Actinospica sp.]|uniref:hypothetical protein n=1 Tax=Actinospica sp. TaxID=1872142 RepID=UPI002D02CF8E|nr:hypothetical protein [Actinospica sp.]HWG23682.1 hypothetical protein [Actinospica sp.]